MIAKETGNDRIKMIYWLKVQSAKGLENEEEKEYKI